MPFKSPISNPLTQAQSEVLSKFSAMKTFLTIPLNSNTRIPKSQQISSFDFLLKLAAGTVGTAAIDILLKSFLDKIFDENNDKLEKMVIKALASALKKNGKEMSKTKTNEEWLFERVHPVFKIAKITLALYITTLVFGPKKNMDKYVTEQDSSKEIFEAAVCSNQTFSLSNSPNEPQGDIEYNKAELRRQLTEGNIEFIISCQSVKIKLPENIEQVLKAETVKTPADIFSNLNNFVAQETQRQNAPENANAINKSFQQTIIEKIFNLISFTIGAQLGPVFDIINGALPAGESVTVRDIIPSPCELVNNPDDEKKKEFYTVLINLLYALLISIILTFLINKIKKLIKRAFQEKARAETERKIEKQKQRFAFLDKAGKALGKAKMVKLALSGINSIYNFIKDI